LRGWKAGVNVNGIAMLQKATTGSAFVSYRSQAQRDFIFNMPNSAWFADRRPH
jgi:sugar/nucleoside kinase (ribokinase family)